jgi:transcriptional regulator with XRE-family HTH domain
MAAVEETAGTYIARARKLENLTQKELADRAHVSVSLLKKVEQHRAPASPSLISSVARALGRSIAELQGQPYPAQSREDDSARRSIAAIRGELTSYVVPPDPEIAIRSVKELTTDVHLASSLRHQANLIKLASLLPGLLSDLRAAAYANGGAERERLFALLAETYAAAGQVVYKLGYDDLYAITVDRYEWAAQRAGDVGAGATAAYLRAGLLIGSAEFSSAQRYLEEFRSRELEPSLRGDSPALLSMWGNLHLKSGLAASRAGDAATADGHLQEAQETANRIGVDRDDYRLAFGPTNVQIWGVALAVERLDGTTAVRRAAGFEPPATTPPERTAHHWIDLARGYFLHGSRQDSLNTLLRAREVAPQMTRFHPQVRETVTALAEADRRSTRSLAGFARWVGV